MKPMARFVCAFLFQGLIFSPAVVSGELVLTAEEKQWLVEKPIIRLSPNPEFAPIEEINSSGEYVGMAADYMALIETRMGIKFTVVTYPSWEEVISQTKRKNIDVLAAVTPSIQRERYLNFASPHIKLPGMIFVTDQIPGTINITDLERLRVASPTRYIWFELIGYDHPQIKLIESPTLRQGLRGLSFGQLDAVIADPASVSHIIKQEGINNLRIGGVSGYNFELAFAARKDWPILHSILEKSVQSITEAEHNAIFNRWIQINRKVDVSNNHTIGIVVGLVLVILTVLTFIFVNRLLRIRVAGQIVELNRANESLSVKNEDLVKRVVKSTHDLKKAMLNLKKSQTEVVQSEKMVELGQMMTGIAQEINTPLGYALSNLMVMKDFVGRVKVTDDMFRAWKVVVSDEFASEESISDLFQEIDDAFTGLNKDDLIAECEELVLDTLHGLDQISEIIHNLKNFSRLNPAETAEVNLNENIERTLKLVQHLLKENIDVKLSLGELPVIKCNPSKINQVLLNLITNACRAINVSGKEHGKLSIVTSCDGDRVHVSIKDNGIGIPKKVGKKMFDPLYTTKKSDQGAGLGLSICYNIVVKEHKGKIRVQTREGIGTRFIISLRVNGASASVIDTDHKGSLKVSFG
jgi:signal transduction histidine kinase